MGLTSKGVRPASRHGYRAVEKVASCPVRSCRTKPPRRVRRVARSRGQQGGTGPRAHQQVEPLLHARARDTLLKGPNRAVTRQAGGYSQRAGLPKVAQHAVAHTGDLVTRAWAGQAGAWACNICPAQAGLGWAGRSERSSPGARGAKRQPSAPLGPQEPRVQLPATTVPGPSSTSEECADCRRSRNSASPRCAIGAYLPEARSRSFTRACATPRHTTPGAAASTLHAAAIATSSWSRCAVVSTAAA